MESDSCSFFMDTKVANIKTRDIDNLCSFFMDTTEENEELFLVSQCRHPLPVKDALRPFGAMTQLIRRYSAHPRDIAFIASQQIDVEGVQIVGTSQAGVYFRVMSGTDIRRTLSRTSGVIIASQDLVEFAEKQARSFVFPLATVFSFVEENQSNVPTVPLLWYCDTNSYGYEPGEFCVDGTVYTYGNGAAFEEAVRAKYSCQREHEVVLRIPIPLTCCRCVIGKRLNF